MIEFKEIIERPYKKDFPNTLESWYQLRDDMIQFMHEDHPIEEKMKIAPLGALEWVYMAIEAFEELKEEKEQKKAH